MTIAKLNRRAVIKGIAGTSLALPVLEAMGQDVAEQTPRRFCAMYTANGMSLPKQENGINDWNWFPTTEGSDFEFNKSTEPLSPFRDQVSFLGGLYHQNGTIADPHVCSDMWLTGAPLHDPSRATYNSAGLDQVIALHTKQYCRQPSLVLSIDAPLPYRSQCSGWELLHSLSSRTRSSLRFRSACSSQLRGLLTA